MKALLKPYWILLFVVLPQIFLIAIYSSSLAIIKSLLSPENIKLITYFGVAVLFGIIASSLYSFILIVRRKSVHGLIFGIILLAYYITFFVLYSNNHNILPWNIPPWMVSSDDLLKYLITCLMPPLLYGLILLVLYFTPEEKEHEAWVSFLSMVGIPAFWYFAFMIVAPLMRSDSPIEEYVFITLFVVSAVAFNFFLIRWIYVIAINKNKDFSDVSRGAKVVIALILPVTGLVVNQQMFGSNIFGDFTNFGFYLVAVFNGLLFCIPTRQKAKVTLVLFVLKAITLSYTFYFFLVFLPYLPLSFLAVIIVGLGLLMLTPLALFVVHVQDLLHHYQRLSLVVRKWKLSLMLIVGFLVLPAVITLKYYSDRRNINNALDYVYEPNFNSKEEFDASSVASVIKRIASNKEDNFNFSHSQTPYLSTYYNWIVMDNLTLSDVKLQLMEKIFLGESEIKIPVRDSLVKDENVKIVDYKSTSRFDKANNCWKTWVDFKIDNNQEFRGEYATRIHLPQGCWISNYYLNVDGKKKFGLLAEKKSAQWIYNQIVSYRRDPGILYYVGNNEVMFRVFPFNARERRTTGIEFMHYEPIKVEIDGNPIQMGSTESTDNSYKNESFIYLSSKAKASLPTVARTPYYHFIIDCSNPTMTKTIGSFRASLGSRATDEEISETKENKVKILEEQINQVLSRKAIPSGKVLISFSDYRTQTFNLDQNWKEAYRASEFKGGFFLDRTIKESLVASYFSHKAEYPVFVVISDNLENAVRNQSLTDIPYTFPESSSFFHLKPNASLSEYSFQNFKEVEPVADEASPFARKNVHIWKNQNGDQFFFPVDGEGALIIQNLNKITKETTGKTALDQALALQAMSMKMDLMPEQTGELWLPIIKESFSSKIMTPHTSYLVVENEAQEKALLAKQQQVLNAKKSLDIDEEERMSEPEFWIILILFIAFVAWKRRRALITVL